VKINWTQVFAIGPSSKNARIAPGVAGEPEMPHRRRWTDPDRYRSIAVD